MTCKSCNDTKECNWCYNGKVDAKDDSGMIEDCLMCKGTGICQVCDINGEHIKVFFTAKKTCQA
jgi:hypothetical protein